VTAHLPKIDVPALVICGEHDAISPLTEMEQLAAKMPNARFVKIAGAGQHVAPGSARRSQCGNQRLSVRIAT